jgi:putative acetyltransferase
MTRSERADIIHSIRHFNRYYTNRLGLLSRYRFDTKFTLTETRVILEIGRHGELTQTGLKTSLSIDTGYLSRIVKRLVSERLVEARRDTSDGRLLVLHLTNKGRSLMAKIDDASDADAEKLVGDLSEAETRELVDHLRAAESILEKRMSRSYVIAPVEKASEIATVRVLIREYVAFLGADLSFQDIESELAGLPGKYAPPAGALYLASVPTMAGGAEPAGCVALRRLGPGICEMKRLFVRPEYRGLGLGKALAEIVIRAAAERGYSIMRLDTLERLEGAVRLYKGLGFSQRDPYCANPLPGAMFWEKKIG